MSMRRDKETRRQGDKETARRAWVTLSPCPIVSLSPRPPVPLSPCPLVSLSSRAAFTLPEVLATLVLIGVVLPVAMKGVSLALAASDDARRRVQAVGLAENKLAEITADATTDQTTAGSSGDFGDEAPGYTWETSATSVDTNLTELHVRVSWTARGAARHVDLSSYAYASAAATGTGDTAAASAGGGAP